VALYISRCLQPNLLPPGCTFRRSDIDDCCAVNGCKQNQNKHPVGVFNGTRKHSDLFTRNRHAKSFKHIRAPFNERIRNRIRQENGFIEIERNTASSDSQGSPSHVTVEHKTSTESVTQPTAITRTRSILETRRQLMESIKALREKSLLRNLTTFFTATPHIQNLPSDESLFNNERIGIDQFP